MSGVLRRPTKHEQGQQAKAPAVKAPKSASNRTGRALKGSTIEDSVQLRVVALACVLVGVVSVIAQGVISPLAAVASLTLIPLAYWFSHKHRTKKNIALKVMLAVGMMVALGGFLRQVRFAGSVDEARAYLAELFLWVQILHSFDLPRRKDIAYSIASSLVLIAAAGALSVSSTFGLFILAYLPLVAAWLYLSNRRGLAERATSIRLVRPDHAPVAKPVRPLLKVGLLALAIGILVFAVTPRVQGIQLVAPPFSLGGAASSAPIDDFDGQLVNPGQSATDPGVFSEDAYPGFSDTVDLRVRGRLSDDLVMRVRAAQPAFWRAGAYDTWDGTSWTFSGEATIDVSGSAPVSIPAPPEPHLGPTKPLLQTFFMESVQPNIIFAADEPRQVFFPVPGLKIDDSNSIRTPLLMEPGLIYSVISDLPIASPADLRGAATVRDPDLLARYTQLPPSTPQRVLDLSDEVTRNASTTYDKVMAVQDWLKENTEYLLDIPADPPGVDAVDHFLFETQQGYCEHFSAAMIVMLRAQGIPARFAVGFDSGERNVFTGYYEVRGTDAHSWVEVYYPKYGWMPYDPTNVVPLAQETETVSFGGFDIFGAIGSGISGLIPQGVRDGVGEAFRGVGNAAGWAADNWAVTFLVALIISALIALLARLRRRVGREPPDTRVAVAFGQVSDLFAERGHPRDPSRTPSEYLADLIRSDGLALQHDREMRTVFRSFERDRFAGATDDADSARIADEAEKAAAALRAAAQRKVGFPAGR